MNSPIITGTKTVVWISVYVLILCLLLNGCSGKSGSNIDEGTAGETISDALIETSAITDEENTQSGTTSDSTVPEEKITADDPVISTEPSQLPTEEVVPVQGNSGISTTDQTTAVAPENDENDMPDNGIELPDDNWD